MHESSEIVKQHLQMMLESEQKERERIATIPEPQPQDWEFQKEIDLLIASGFAILDEQSTDLWKRRAWHDGKASYHRCYSWTLEGKEACFRNKYTTPMSWADDIQKGARHCVICGRDLYRMKVWAQIKGKSGCVCMSCGAKGHGLQDLQIS